MKGLQTIKFTIFSFVLILIAGAKILAAGGDLDATFTAGAATFGTTVNVVVVQPDGRVLVGGNFTAVNGRSSPGLVRLNADGTTDQSFSVGTGVNFGANVNAIAVQTDGKILVGGGFVEFNGVTRYFLVRLNADGSLDTGFNMGGAGITSGFSLDLITLQPNGQILIGGFFFDYNGTTVNNFARLNPNGSLDTSFTTNLGTGFDGTISSVALEPDGQIVVGGIFNNVNGTTANRIARLNANGTLDTTFITNTGAGFSNSVFAVALQTDGRIVVGGFFSQFNGTPQQSLARLNADGTLDLSFISPSPGSGVVAIAIQTDGRILIMGENGATFGSGAETRQGIARLNAADGSIDASFDAGAGPNGTVNRTVAFQLDGSIFVGGNFTALNNIVRSALAKLNTNGSVNLGFTTVIGMPAQVYKLLVLPDNKILLGGDFRGVNESFRDAIARLNADGSTDLTFNPGSGTGSTGFVLSIAVQTDGKIIVGGNFSSFGGVSNFGIARLNADGSRDATFNASANGTVNAVAIQTDGKILIGGNFNGVNSVPVNAIARLNNDGTTDTTFNSGGTGFDFFGSVQVIVLQTSGQILVGGGFTNYNGTNGVNNIVRLNSNGTLDLGFTTNSGTGFDGTVNTLALQTDGKILVGGSFLNFNGASSSEIARLNPDGSRDTNFNVGMGFSNLVYDFALQPDGRILVVGGFSTYNGITRWHLARLNTDGSLDASFRSGVQINNNLNTVGLQSDGRIIIGGALQRYDNTPRYGIARISAGDTITWTGASGTNWNNGANWTGGFVPTAADNAIIPNNSSVNLSSGNFSVLTLTVGTNSTLTIVSGSSLTIEGGTNNGTIAGAGTLNFIGTSLGNNGTISVSAVNAQVGTSANKVLTGSGGFTGNLLTISGGITFAIQSNHQFNAIDIQSNAILDATSRTLNLRGANPLQGDGFIENTFGTIIFDGAAAQTVARSVTFNNLTINNAAGVTFSGSAFHLVTGALNLTNGVLANNTLNALTMDNNATATRTNGYVIGLMSKRFFTAGLPAFTFQLGTANGYAPVTVAITSGTTEVFAAVQQTNQPVLNPSTSLRRYWTLNAAGTFTANLTFNYLQGDVFGNENNYRITRVSGGVPQSFANNCGVGSPCVNPATNTAFISGVTAFSDWTLSEFSPTAANVSIGGRVLTGKGNGISGVIVSLTDSNGLTRNVLTNTFGFYRFDEVRAGETYVANVRHKKFQFNPSAMVINAYENALDINFFGEN